LLAAMTIPTVCEGVLPSARMSRLAHLVAVLLGSVLLTLALPARARDKVDRAADELKHSDDFRVRTQAALALGASKSKRALTPLCNGLEDSNTTVRAASAAALGKLKLSGGRDCLKKRLDDESNSTVKSSIKKALSLLSGGVITSKTKYYIAIAKVTDKTGRSGTKVDAMVRAAMEKAAGDLDGYVIAPGDESLKDAKGKLARNGSVKAFYLLPAVPAPKYSGGTLKVKIEVTMFTYPGKALKGSFSVNLTQEDVDDKDEDSENDLIKMASSRAMEKFSQNVERLE
jgi:HEAT repeats